MPMCGILVNAQLILTSCIASSSYPALQRLAHLAQHCSSSVGTLLRLIRCSLSIFGEVTCGMAQMQAPGRYLEFIKGPGYKYGFGKIRPVEI